MESYAKVATGDRVRMIKMLSPRTRRYLFLSELFLMITENLLFTSFVQGIPSGVSATKTNEESRGLLELCDGEDECMKKCVRENKCDK